MDLDTLLMNVHVDDEVSIKLDPEVVFAIEYIKRNNQREFTEEKLINYALKKLFYDLGLLNQKEENPLIFSSDHLNAYMQVHVLSDYKSSIASDQLYEHYFKWCLDKNIDPMTKQELYKEICKLGAVKRRTNKGYKFYGISLIR